MASNVEVSALPTLRKEDLGDRNVFRPHVNSILSSLSSTKVEEIKLKPQSSLIVSISDRAPTALSAKLHHEPQFRIVDETEGAEDSLKSSAESDHESKLVGIADMHQEGLRHYRKLSKEIEKTNKMQRRTDLDEEVITPTSTNGHNSRHTRKSESEYRSIDNSIGSERLVNIIEKENSVQLKKEDSYHIKDSFF